MQIRKANKNDDTRSILQLLYDTDPYIYPVLMNGDIANYEYILNEGMYHYNNITLATVNNEIAGLIVSFKNDVSIQECTNKELNAYCHKLKSSLDAQSEYINNVSVFEKFRGIGIATKLIQYIEQNSTMNKLVLDCLAENKKTVSLYKRLGFSIIETSRTFCLDKTKEIYDVRMVKYI